MEKTEFSFSRLKPKKISSATAINVDKLWHLLVVQEMEDVIKEDERQEITRRALGFGGALLSLLDFILHVSSFGFTNPEEFL